MVEKRIERQTPDVCSRRFKTTHKYNKTGNMNNRKNDGLWCGDLSGNVIKGLTEDRLLQTRAELEIELYRLDREMSCMDGCEWMSDSQSRTVRDVEIDRDFILSKIEELEHEIRERNLGLDYTTI